MDISWNSSQIQHPQRESGIGNDTQGPNVVAQGKARRALRIRMACSRCQRRKIRTPPGQCDGAIPSCSSCKKAGDVCVDGGRQHEREFSTAYIASLKDRINWLESPLNTNCPDFNLNQGPRVLDELNRPQSTTNEQQSFNQRPLTPTTSPLVDVLENVGPIGSLHPSADALSSRQQGTKPQQTSASASNEIQPERLAHEIGLVSVTAGQDPRYVGPSSGYFFTKLVLACAGRQGRKSPPGKDQAHYPVSVLASEAFHIPPTLLPSSLEHAIQLSETYWQTVHSQYPFLHQSSHIKLIEHVYGTEEPSPIAAFQVNMVLAISATALSRRQKVPLSAGGFCVNAMKYFGRLPIEGSLKGLQSLLLLLVYAMNSSSIGLNVWYLNYQCIAAVLDLGLQRDVKAGNNLSFLDQEMRTRIFWVVYSLDRTLATILGRPIGLRDEACELRVSTLFRTLSDRRKLFHPAHGVSQLPQDVEDGELAATYIAPRFDRALPTPMTNAIHHFKLARLNSEIKYVAHSISHDTPAYTYPRIPNIREWQQDMVGRLQQWASEIPQFDGVGLYMTKQCEIECHGLMMLLLRPNPAIKNPSEESLKVCHESAVSSIRLFDELYRGDLLVYNWATLHSVFLATITMLYCIWVVPDIASETKLDVLMADLKSSSNVLSATGEYWTEAGRSRDVLDELSNATIRWTIESRARTTAVGSRGESNGRSMGSIHDRHSTRTQAANKNDGSQNSPGNLGGIHADQDFLSQVGTGSINEFLNPELYSSLFLNDPSSNEQMDPSAAFDIDALMQGVFGDFPPILDHGQDFFFDGQI